MKTGIELIADERREQIEKHGRTVEKDVEFNNRGELVVAAQSLCVESLIDIDDEDDIIHFDDYRPFGWDEKVWEHMAKKPYKERLIIAGALIAAEIDRIQNS